MNWLIKDLKFKFSKQDKHDVGFFCHINTHCQQLNLLFLFFLQTEEVFDYETQKCISKADCPYKPPTTVAPTTTTEPKTTTTPVVTTPEQPNTTPTPAGPCKCVDSNVSESNWRRSILKYSQPTLNAKK